MSFIDLNKIRSPKKNITSSIKVESFFGRVNLLLSKDISIGFGNTINDKFKENFYAELSLLLSEGIDIKSSLTIIVEETENNKISDQLADIKELIINGEKLADAIKTNPSFTNYEFYSIAIGEESGKLIEVMKELSIYFQRKVKLKRQLSGALIYPAIVLLVAFGAVTFMLNFVVPMFSEVFKRFKGDLPYITKLIIESSAFFKSYFLMFLFILLSLILGIYTQRKKDWFRAYTSQALLHLPVFGELIRKIYLARFCQSLALLLRSHVSIIKSLDLVKNMIDFHPIESTIEPIKSSILKGESLHCSLMSFAIYNRKMVNMIKVAEDVNKLDEMLAKISIQLSEETEHQIEIFNKLLEPILILLLGAIVGTILVAMYLPLFQLGSQIGS